MTEDEKVSTVKELVSERLNIPANQQRLLYKGKALAGSFCCSKYFINFVHNWNCLTHQSVLHKNQTFKHFWLLLSLDEHRLSDYSIGPEAKLNLVIRPLGERTGASGMVASSSNSSGRSSTQGRVWQTVSTILARHFSPADAAKVHEQLIKVFKWMILTTIC